jgi:hypothetical protein
MFSLLWLPIVKETSFIENVIQRGFRIAFKGSRGGSRYYWKTDGLDGTAG